MKIQYSGSSMSWTQVYVTGLAQTVEPCDDDLEDLLAKRYCLDNHHHGDDNDNLPHVDWAGPGTSLFKRDPTTNASRGYAFLSFLTLESAETMVARINNHTTEDPAADATTSSNSTELLLPPNLRAELSKPKPKNKSNKKKNSNDKEDLADVRLRRKRAPPIRKHPVIVSSDKKKTGLGNKTK